jgi:hypothetical protein
MMKRQLPLVAILLWGCPSAGPRPETELPSRVEPSAHAVVVAAPLLDASAFVEGRVVGDELGWVFESAGRKSERVPWPRIPMDPLNHAPCMKLSQPEAGDEVGQRLLAWPIVGTGRLLVLGDEPLIAQMSPGRPGCVVAVPARTQRPELGTKRVEVSAHNPRIALFGAEAPDPALVGLAFVERGQWAPRLVFPGGEIEPDGVELEDTDLLGCVSPEDAKEYELDVEPARHVASLSWRGDGRVEELVVALTQRCSGDPSQQGGAVEYERELEWVLERDDTKLGWRQARVRIESRQSSSGDGVSQRDSRSQVVHSWRVGSMAWVGRWVEADSGSVSNWGASSDHTATSQWWLVPQGALAEGFDPETFDKVGLRMTPPMVEPKAAADRRLEAGEHRVTDRCKVRLVETDVELACGEAVAYPGSLPDLEGRIERLAEVWDLGASLLVKLTLDRDHPYEVPSEDDPTRLVEHSDQMSYSLTVVVSKRDGTLLEVARSSGSTSI